MKRLVFCLLLAAVGAEGQSWRTYAGGFGSRWNTSGHHGHDHPACGAITPDCDAADFARANLDDSIGFRAGRERDFWSLGALHVVGGADASVSHTEYNSSQRDLSLVSAALFAGAEVALGGVRIGARYGAGGYTTTATPQPALLRYAEMSVTLPLRRGASVRLSRRHALAREASAMIVADGLANGDSMWEFTAATGTTMPGAGAGGDRKLRATAMNRTAALRTLWRPDLQLEISWTSTAHESSLPSVFLGYGGNFRSKTVEGCGVALSRIRPLSDTISLRWSGGLEVADWRDEHRLLTRDGAELVAGVEAGFAAGAAMRVQLQPRLAIETSLQKVYWRSIDLGEARWAVGIVLTR